MRIVSLLFLCIALAGMAFGADVPVAAPEVGVDGPTIAAAVGVLSGGLLIMRSRRNKK